MLKPTDRGTPEVDMDRSFGELAQQVLDDGRAYLQAEVKLLQVRATSRIALYRGAAQLAFGALLFGIAAMVALAVAVVLIAMYYLGAVGGGLLGVAIFVLVAGGLGLAAKKAFERADD